MKSSWGKLAAEWEGKNVRVTSGPLKGATGKVVRRSQRTGGLTIKLEGVVPPFSAGEEVHLNPHEVEKQP